MKAGVEGPVVQSASSTSADPDIDDVAARSRAAFRIKILEHKDGHKRSSTVQDSVNDLRKLMSKVELLQVSTPSDNSRFLPASYNFRFLPV